MRSRKIKVGVACTAAGLLAVMLTRDWPWAQEPHP